MAGADTGVAHTGDTNATEFSANRAAGRSPHAAAKFVTYSLLVGAASGVFQLGEVIAVKSLMAGALGVTLLTMANPIANLTSLWWSRVLAGRDQSAVLRNAALGCGLAVATGWFLGSLPHLFAIFFFYYAFLSLTYTVENRALQQHISPRRTGRLFGVATALRTVLGALVAAGAGFYMDRHSAGYRHLFGASAVLCFVGILHLATIPAARNGTQAPARLSLSLLFEPLAQVVPLLRARKDFLRFELGFMIYGCAYMMAMPIVPLFLVEDLELSYGTIGLARGGVHLAGLALAMPLFGRLFDRSTPHRLSAATFFLLAFFPLSLLAAAAAEGAWRLAFLYGGFGLFGFAMGGVVLLWSLSSIRFAGKEDVGAFHSIHVTATGIRGVFAPLLGLAVMTATSKEFALAVIAALWLLSALAMVALRLLDIRTGAYRSLRAGTWEERATIPDVEARR